MDSRVIGINLWPAPQISEHCPTMMLGRLIMIDSKFIRPGVASTLIPKDGIVHEWITSFDVTIIRIGVLIGSIRWLEVSINRIIYLLFNVELKMLFFMFEYSYLQNHWNAIVLIDMIGWVISSIMYKVLRDGIAIKINIRAGREVQNNSISCASKKNRLKELFNIEIDIKCRVIKVTITKMIIEWSWKKIRCSINGEFLFWNEILDQVGIVIYYNVLIESVI